MQWILINVKKKYLEGIMNELKSPSATQQSIIKMHVKFTL